MKLKINRYEFDVTNRDWILDNGSCYQCMTLTHRVLEYKVKLIDTPTIMSKLQFKQLVKENKLIEVPKQRLPEQIRSRYSEDWCRIWKFNVEE